MQVENSPNGSTRKPLWAILLGCVCGVTLSLCLFIIVSLVGPVLAGVQDAAYVLIMFFVLGGGPILLLITAAASVGLIVSIKAGQPVR